MKHRQLKGVLATAVLCALVIGAFSLIGCASGSTSSTSSASSASAESPSATSEASASDASSTEASSSAEEPSSEPAAIAGGWTIPASNGVADLTDEESEIFEKALGAQAGMDFKPIAILATQVVAGQNYAYLCKGTPTTQNPVEEWDVVVVYQDLQGDASITSVTPIDLADIKTTDDTAAEAVGAWEVREATSGVAMTVEAAKAFSKASEEYDGVVINPLALLGTQVVAGTNYLILGTGNAVVQSPVTAVYVATVYEDLEGNAEFTDVSQFDLLAYVG